MTRSLAPAGLARRLGAMLYDALLVFAIWLMTLFVIVAATGSAVTGPALQSLLFVEHVGFFLFFWFFKGQTLGMLAWRLTLVSVDGKPLTLAQLFTRLIGAALSFACAGLGYLWILRDAEQRSWSDLMSDSRVVCTPKD